jgi:glycosyltransferase involved in cell wall biosynthesis
MPTMKTKKLYVDCQVFQHNTWNRGMGRYTLKLLGALDKEVDLTLIFTSTLSLDRKRQKAIKAACPAAKILHLRLPHDPNRYGGWKELQEVCASILDEQLKGIVNPDDTYLIASNFSLRYCSTFPNFACRKALLFYDLTPYLHWPDFKNTPDFEPKKYFAQFKTLFNADQLWAISESAADEAKHWLGIDSGKVANIRGSSIRDTQEIESQPSSVGDVKFLLCPSADGPHKNNENIVRAFAAFNEKSKHAYKLVITSDFSYQSQNTLNDISKDLIFAGHVADGELSWLYQHCEAVLFVSKNEGLGLPILEGVAAGKKVICSDIKVFREISDKAFYYADPNNIQDIAMTLGKALVSEEAWPKKQKQYAEISHKFSWESVAQSCLTLLGSVTGSRRHGLPRFQQVWYSDSDQDSLARNIAELFYPLNQKVHFYALRKFKYTYAFPSYLVDMGVARPALDNTITNPAPDNIFVVDDSEEGAQLLLYALQKPGYVIAAFDKTQTPRQIAKYLRDSFDGALSQKTLMHFLTAAGNRITYETQFSKRGSEAFVREVRALHENLQKGA